MNDLRYFLAVAREGSTLAAGRSLRVSQTTVARRIAALEESLSFPLFDRRQAGYALTPAGEELVTRAEEVERSATSFADAAAAHSRDLTGMVTLTTHEMIAVTLLNPFLRELHKRHPDIVINIDTRDAVLDLGKGEADIALRSTTATTLPAGIVGRRICLDDWTLYCSRDYAAQHGLPQNEEDLKRHNLIGGGGPGLWRHYLGWLRELGSRTIWRSFMHTRGLTRGVRSGFGRGAAVHRRRRGQDLLRCFPHARITSGCCGC